MAAVHDENRTGSRSSDPEKFLDSKDTLAAAGFEDPDAGLSDEERAAIVRYLCISVSVSRGVVPILVVFRRTNPKTNDVGSQATLETRSSPRPMA